MKSGVRALGIAESYRGASGSSPEDSGAQSTLAGVVTRADRVVDGCCFGSCTVGGTDATDAVRTLFDRLDRPDVRYLFLGAIAPAWYNLLDLPTIAAATDRPVLCVTFEESTGLDESLRAAFSGEGLDARLATYRAQPPRRKLWVNGETVFVRSTGFRHEGAPVDDAPGNGAHASDESTDGVPEEVAEVVRAFTPEGGRPEPLRIARLAARAADAWQDGDEPA